MEERLVGKGLCIGYRGYLSPVTSEGSILDVDQADNEIVVNGDGSAGLAGEPINESEQEGVNFMEHYKLKVMARDADGDKYKFMLHYKHKEVGANSLSQTRIQIFQQGGLGSLQNTNSNPVIASEGIETETQVVEQGLNLVA